MYARECCWLRFNISVPRYTREGVVCGRIKLGILQKSKILPLRAPYGFDFVLRTPLRMTRRLNRNKRGSTPRLHRYAQDDAGLRSGVTGRGGDGYGMRHSEWRRVCAAIEPRRGGPCALPSDLCLIAGGDEPLPYDQDPSLRLRMTVGVVGGAL